MVGMKTVLNVKTDKDIKEQAQQLARYLGIPLSTVVNAYLREFVNQGEFKVRREPSLQPSVRAEITRAQKEVCAGKQVSPTFKDAGQAIAWLEK